MWFFPTWNCRFVLFILVAFSFRCAVSVSKFFFYSRTDRSFAYVTFIAYNERPGCVVTAVICAGDERYACLHHCKWYSRFDKWQRASFLSSSISSSSARKQQPVDIHRTHQMITKYKISPRFSNRVVYILCYSNTRRMNEYISSGRRLSNRIGVRRLSTCCLGWVRVLLAPCVSLRGK